MIPAGVRHAELSDLAPTMAQTRTVDIALLEYLLRLIFAIDDDVD